MLAAKSSVGPARRGASISPSPYRKPSASSSSWPGVRIVTASGAPSMRISSGSSSATRSSRPSRTIRAVRCMASVSAMAIVLAHRSLFSATENRSTLRSSGDADADRHARSALPARARAGGGALAPPPSPRPRVPAARRVRRVLHRRLPRAAVRHVRADDRRDDAVLRRRARPAADRRRALEQPAVAGLRRPQVRLRQVLGERHLLRRGALRRVPRRPRLAVAALVLAGAADREQVEVGRAAVDELAADGRRDADQLAGLVRGLLALDEQAERSLEHEVDLLLALVGVDPPALAGVKHDLVEPEARDAELGPEAHEAVLGVVLEARGGGAVVHGRDPMPAAARSSRPPRRPAPRR